MIDKRIESALRQLTQRTGRQIIAMYPYAYPIDFSATIGSGASDTQSLSLEQDGHFLMERLHANTWDNAGASNASAILRRNVTLQITDQAAQANLFDAPVLLGCIAGDAYVSQWFTVVEPRVFLANSSVLFQVKNNMTLTLAGTQVSLIGRKVILG